MSADSRTRDELCAIGETLADIGAARAPVNVEQIGDLMKRLALLCGRLANQRERSTLEVQMLAKLREGEP